MELIKKIKQAETQAQEVIEQAKARTAEHAEKSRQNQRQALEETEQARKKAIEAAVSTAQAQGLAEVENLKARAEKERQQLRNDVADKIAGAAAKVMDYLGSHRRLRGDEFTPAETGAKKRQNGGPLKG